MIQTIMDQPVIDYGTTKTGGLENSAADVREMDELAEAYKRKKQDGNVAGKTVSLGEFIKGKV